MKKNILQRGFTLLELLVGMVITGIIVMGVTSFMVLLFSSNLRLKQVDLLEQTKYDIQNDISNAARWAQTITIHSSGNGFTVINTDGKSTVYQFQNNQLLKNSVSIVPDDVSITQMSVTDNSGTPDLASLDIHLALEQRSFRAAQSTAHIVISQRRVNIKL